MLYTVSSLNSSHNNLLSVRSSSATASTARTISPLLCLYSLAIVLPCRVPSTPCLLLFDPVCLHVLQHLQMRYFMPDLYGNSQRVKTRPLSPTTTQLSAGVPANNLSSIGCRLDSAGEASGVNSNERFGDAGGSPQRQHDPKQRCKKLGDDVLAPAVEKTCCGEFNEERASIAAVRSSVMGVEIGGLD